MLYNKEHYMHVSENPVTNKFAPVEPPPKMSPTEEAELNRPTTIAGILH